VRQFLSCDKSFDFFVMDNGTLIQRGHTFDIQFKMKIVGDSLEYIDTNDKSKGYFLHEGKKKLKTVKIDVASKVGQPKKNQGMVMTQLSNLKNSVTLEWFRNNC